MSFKTVPWTLLAAMAAAGVLLLNYWASYQPLSTLAYSGIVLAFAGLANVVLPFRFLGVRKRAVGALVLAGGVALAFAALYWPASMTRVAQPKNRLDEIMPEYQFSEKHSARVHARPAQALEAVRESTLGDLKSLVALMKIRAAVLRAPYRDNRGLQAKRIFDAFSEAGYLPGGSGREIASFGVWNARTNRRPNVTTLKELADYREPGAVKMAFDFTVEDAGEGWSTITTETRVLVVDDATRRGFARYWRLIVPGSGLLRLQWLDGIKNRAERPFTSPADTATRSPSATP
jgi:hypothetical protein